MSKQINDGGPAWPTPNHGSSWTDPDGMITFACPGKDGMSIRDWLAGMAMQGMIGNSDYWRQRMYAGIDKPKRDMNEEEIAQCAMAMADAMLRERESVREAGR